MVTRAMLTTIDNPYDPFTEWMNWLQFDTSHGYNTSGLLARIAFTSEELSELDQLRATELAIDEIIELNVAGIYKKVTEEIEL